MKKDSADEIPRWLKEGICEFEQHVILLLIHDFESGFLRGEIYVSVVCDPQEFQTEARESRTNAQVHLIPSPIRQGGPGTDVKDVNNVNKDFPQTLRSNRAGNLFVALQKHSQVRCEICLSVMVREQSLSHSSGFGGRLSEGSEEASGKITMPYTAHIPEVVLHGGPAFLEPGVVFGAELPASRTRAEPRKNQNERTMWRIKSTARGVDDSTAVGQLGPGENAAALTRHSLRPTKPN
ncbi:hypothetical protein DFH09DRAFT_1067449 [Mycena vulgaris]|nr:hypothetical protein DFH09DRAFT_1067449 [Mycena vulgaris]